MIAAAALATDFTGYDIKQSPLHICTAVHIPEYTIMELPPARLTAMCLQMNSHSSSDRLTMTRVTATDSMPRLDNIKEN